MSDLLKIAGNNIRHYRLKKKLTQKQLAKKIGFHRNYISRIENARVSMFVTTLVKIARVLNVKPKDLVELRRRP